MLYLIAVAGYFSKPFISTTQNIRCSESGNINWIGETEKKHNSFGIRVHLYQYVSMHKINEQKLKSVLNGKFSNQNTKRKK